MKTSNLGLSPPKYLTACMFVDLSIDSHVLQEEASFMWVEGGTGLQIAHNKLSKTENKWLPWLGVGKKGIP